MAWLDDDWMYVSLLDEDEAEENYWKFLLGVPDKETYFCEVTQVNDQAFFKLYDSDVGFDYNEIVRADFDFSTHDRASTTCVSIDEIQDSSEKDLDLGEYARYIKENFF